MQFEKWQALGNDYVIVERDELPWELTPSADPAASATRTSASAPTGSCCSRHGERPEVRRRATDLQSGRLGGRAVRQRRARGGALPALATAGPTRTTFSIITKAGRGDSDDHRPGDRIDGHREGDVDRSEDFPSGPPDGAGRVSLGGAEWAFQHVSVGNPQCAIEVADGLERLDLAEFGPGIEGTRGSSRTGPTSRSRRPTARRCEHGSSSAGWGRRSPPAPAPAAPRSPRSCGGATSPITVELDGGELKVEITDDLDVTPRSAWAEPVYAGELSPELVEFARGRLTAASAASLPRPWP